MECCAVNGLDKYFDQENAKQKVEEYLASGLEQRAQYMVAFLRDKGLAGQRLLDIGCGVGSLLLELLKGGAEKGTGVDASSAAIQAARDLAEKLQLSQKAEYQGMDFALRPETVSPADIVIMDRVVCCYPKMKELVIPAAQHAKQFFALTYPQDLWWVRLRIALENLFYWIARIEFRSFLHPPAEIFQTIVNQGFDPIFQQTSGEWQITIFQRQNPK